jgi:cysteine synthase
MVTVTGPDGIRTALELASKEGIFTGIAMLLCCRDVSLL